MLWAYDLEEVERVGVFSSVCEKGSDSFAGVDGAAPAHCHDTAAAAGNSGSCCRHNGLCRWLPLCP